MNQLITIFTPTYNRGYLLNKLYNSLKNQNELNFEWIIVDDGSNDDTETIVKSFINENAFKIKYYKKENEGKHIAINKGLDLATSDLFFIVDSDDYLLPNATSLIEQYYVNVQSNKEICGISFRRGYSDTEFIGSGFFENKICNVFDFRYKYKMKGDMAEVYKTEILKQYLFPKFNNEKFCPEALIWNRLGEDYKLLWVSEIVYICEYLEGGLTDNIIRLRRESPIATLLYYKELEKFNIPFLQKLKANINYWRFSKYSTLNFFSLLKDVNIFFSLIGLPLSIIFLIKDK